VFVLARIAGHSSITVTQRYIHPQRDAINDVFTAKLGGHNPEIAGVISPQEDSDEPLLTA